MDGKHAKTVAHAKLRPEYKKELLKIDKGKFKKFSSVKKLER